METKSKQPNNFGLISELLIRAAMLLGGLGLSFMVYKWLEEGILSKNYEHLGIFPVMFILGVFGIGFFINSLRPSFKPFDH